LPTRPRRIPQPGTGPAVVIYYCAAGAPSDTSAAPGSWPAISCSGRAEGTGNRSDGTSHPFPSARTSSTGRRGAHAGPRAPSGGTCEKFLLAGRWIRGGSFVYGPGRGRGRAPGQQSCGCGFTLIDVPSREEALQRAARIAVACRCAQEVREIGGGPGLDAMLGLRHGTLPRWLAIAGFPLAAVPQYRRGQRRRGQGARPPDPAGARHMLRRTYVTTMLDAGADLRDVQIAARHADPRTTMRYDRARNNLDHHPNYILAAYMASGT